MSNKNIVSAEDEQEIIFHSDNIKKKDTGDLFVNVSDAEKVAKKQERKRILAEKQQAKEDEKQQRIAKREKAQKEKAESEAKAKAERKEQQELRAAKAKLRKDEAGRRRNERQEARLGRRAKRQQFFKKYSHIMLTTLAVIIVASAVVAWVFYYNDNRLAITGAQTEQDIVDVQTKVAEIYYGEDIDPDEYGARTDLDYSDTSSENYKKAMNYLNGVIDSTKDNNIKAKAKILKANILLDSKQVDEAKTILDGIDADSLEKEEHGDYLGARMRHGILTNDEDEKAWAESELIKLNGVVDEKNPQ